MSKQSTDLHKQTEHGETKKKSWFMVLIKLYAVEIISIVGGIGIISVVISLCMLSFNQEKKDALANEASHYDVSGAVESIRKTLHPSLFGEYTDYEIQIHGQYVPIGSQLPEDIQVGKQVHVIGDRRGLDELKVVLP